MFLQSAAWRATSGRRGACNAGETRTLLEFSPAYHGSAMAECKAQMRTGLAPSGQQEPDSWCCGQPLIHKHSNVDVTGARLRASGGQQGSTAQPPSSGD